MLVYMMAVVVIICGGNVAVVLCVSYCEELLSDDVNNLRGSRLFILLQSQANIL